MKERKEVCVRERGNSASLRDIILLQNMSTVIAPRFANIFPGPSNARASSKSKTDFMNF